MQLVSGLEAFLELRHTRAALSGWILLSMAPLAYVADYWVIFFSVFACEFIARLLVLVLRREGILTDLRRSIVELVMLALDLFALLSFLPVHVLGSNARYLRVLRLSRLLLLVGYWGPMVLNLISVMLKRERRQQLWFLFLAMTISTILASIFLDQFARAELTHLLNRPVDFLEIFWWSFRQIQDPGNLVGRPFSAVVVLTSLGLTMMGLFLFSFLIGIGTNVVAEMIDISREQPMGLKGHSVVINLTHYSHYFLSEVVAYYRKQVKRPRWILLGREQDPPEYLAAPEFRDFVYRRGNAYHSEDLARMDVSTAKRIIIHSNPQAEDPDSETISTLLSVRRANRQARVVAEIIDEKNIPIALRAGGHTATITVPTEIFVALYLAKLIIHPDIQPLIDELIGTRGDEAYSYIYPSATERSGDGLTSPLAFMKLLRWALEEHDVIIIGLVTKPANAQRQVPFEIGVNPPQSELPSNEIRGLVGITHRFREFRRAAHEFPNQRFESPIMGGIQVAAVADLRVSLSPVVDPSVKILIGNYQSWMGKLLEQLVLNAATTTIYIMVPGAAEIRTAKRDVENYSSSIRRFQNPDQHPIPTAGEFKVRDDGGLHYIPQGGGAPRGAIFFVDGNSASRDDLLKTTSNGYSLFDIDVVLFMSDERTKGDPDAKTVLSLLKILNLHGHPQFGQRFKPTLRVIAGLQDMRKGELVESRFEQEDQGYRTLPISIFSVERIRNQFMFQSIVVPGFDALFGELLGAWGADLMECEPQLPDGLLGAETVTFRDLLYYLYQQYQMILVGVTLQLRDGQRTTTVNPKPGQQGYEFTLRELHRAFVIAAANYRAAAKAD